MREPTKKIKTNIHSFMDKRKQEDSVTITIKLASKVAVGEYSENFSESDHSAYKETSAVTNEFNHPNEDYVNFISADLSAQM